jgi:hypothetical protein
MLLETTIQGQTIRGGQSGQINVPVGTPITIAVKLTNDDLDRYDMAYVEGRPAPANQGGQYFPEWAFISSEYPNQPQLNGFPANSVMTGVMEYSPIGQIGQSRIVEIRSEGYFLDSPQPADLQIVTLQITGVSEQQPPSGGSVIPAVIVGGGLLLLILGNTEEE